MRIAVFGTTGAGKSTLIEHMETKLNNSYPILRENFDHCPYFSDSYVVPPHLAHDFNYKLDIWMLSDRYRLLKESKEMDNVIFDRCILDSGVFGEAAYKAGYTDQRDYEVYSEYFDICVAPTILEDKTNYDVIVYLQVNVDTAIKRLKMRDRDDELHVDQDYWISLTNTYDLWYEKLKDKANFLVIDGNSKTPDQLADEVIERLELKK